MYIILKRMENNKYFRKVGEAESKEDIQTIFGDLVMHGASANDLGIVKDCSVLARIEVIVEEDKDV